MFIGHTVILSINMRTKGILNLADLCITEQRQNIHTMRIHGVENHIRWLTWIFTAGKHTHRMLNVAHQWGLELKVVVFKLGTFSGAGWPDVSVPPVTWICFALMILTGRETRGAKAKRLATLGAINVGELGHDDFLSKVS
jgi:hypothetical protein